MGIADTLGQPHSAVEEAVGCGQATLKRLWLGRGPGLLGLEVQELVAERRPTVATMRQAWAKRRALRANPVLVFWDAPDGESLVCGPSATNEQSVPVTALTSEALATVLRIGLAAPRKTVTPAILDLLDRAQGSGDAPGFRNRGLVSTHCTLVSFARNDEARWRQLANRAEETSGKGGVELLRSLGYSKVLQPGTFVHEQDGRIVVYATSLAADIAIDRMNPQTGRTAAADLLALAREHHALRAVTVMGRVVRTYVVDQAAGDDLSTPATYVELDLDLLEAERRPLIALFAGTNELSQDGAFEQLAAESRRYAIGLRQRFARRVYDAVVGALVTAIHRATPKQHRNDARALFDATLLLLYRLLFVLYAEDRNLLPTGNAEYQHTSLTELLFALYRVEESGHVWDKRATEYWQRLGFIFDGVAHGREDWNVPAYNGGLFSAGAAAGKLLHEIALTNAEIAPILLRLTFDDHDGESGKIDFSDLGIRYLGTLYEGLLGYNVRFADRDLAIVGEEYVPAKENDAIAVKAGDPYLITPQGGRKVSGTYFTPSFVVRRLIDEALLPALDAHLALVALMPPESQFTAMLEFRIVDPAMGSGHFLVDALDAIADRMNAFLRTNASVATKALEDAREHVTAMGKRYGIEDAGQRVGDFELLRRIVLKHCIYGVDMAPMAVELAKLSLWLHAFVPALPLSYLGHNLQHGNSLLGVVGTELDERFGGKAPGTQQKIFWPAIRQLLDDALEPARAIANRGDLSLPDVEESDRLQHELEGKLAPLRRAYNAYAARAFAHEARGPLGESLLGDIVAGKDLGSIERGIPGSAKTQKVRLDDLVNGAAAVATSHDAFHWELAFPEVFCGGRPGFDVVLGNPPWEEVTVERLGFFARYILGIKSLRHRDQNAEIEAYVRRHHEVGAAYQQELQHKEQVRALISGNFALSRGSDPDLYRAFAELAIRISREDGAIGMVYPRMLLAANGSMFYRKALFPGASIVADFALNRGGWMFPDAEHRYTIVALAARKNGSGTIAQAGPAADEKRWSALPGLRTHWQYAELERFSEGAELPLLENEQEQTLYTKMTRDGQPFSAPLGGVRFRPWTPLHATLDRKNGLLKARGRGARGWPVYGGRNFYLWEPEIGETEFVLNPRQGLEVLQRKRLRSDVWAGTPQPILDDPRTLPPNRCTVLFRDVARATDSRTIIACLVPPERFAHNKAPMLVQIGGTERDAALRLAVMCSLPFDWAARRRIETNVNFFILKALPVPCVGIGHALADRAIELAARLACTDDRFASFAGACGVPVGSLSDEAARNDAIAELDALVAGMYGLEAADLETIFDDFTLDAVPLERRDAVRKHFKRLLEQAA